ncbi:hypothetical protein ACWGJX_43070 [Streptomyces sp. NPDC054775]
MTIVIDTKNEMKRSIDGLGTRVNDLERDLRTAFTTEVTGLRETALADLKSSQHETRTRPCFRSGFWSTSRAVMIMVWGVGIFLMSSGWCWSRCFLPRV